MPSNWSDVEKTTAGGLPTMPTQAIIIGTVLGIGAISCSGFYLPLMPLLPVALLNANASCAKVSGEVL